MNTCRKGGDRQIAPFFDKKPFKVSWDEKNIVYLHSNTYLLIKSNI